MLKKNQKITCWMVCEALDRLWRGPYFSSNGSSTISSFTAALLPRDDDDDELDVVSRCPFKSLEFINHKSSPEISKKNKNDLFSSRFFFFVVEVHTQEISERWFISENPRPRERLLTVFFLRLSPVRTRVSPACLVKLRE